MSSFSLEIHSFTSVTGFSKNTASSSPPKILFLFVSFELCLFLLPQTRRVSKTKTPKTRPEIPKPISAQHRFRFGEKKQSKRSLFRLEVFAHTNNLLEGCFVFFCFGRFWGCFAPLDALLVWGKFEEFCDVNTSKSWGLLGMLGYFFLPMIFKKQHAEDINNSDFFEFVDDEKPWLMAPVSLITSYPT